MTKTVLMIDGGALRVFSRLVERSYSGDFVEDFAHACVDARNEHLVRILYYDAPLYEGTVRLPISGDERQFNGGTGFLDDLAMRDRFAVRRGSLAFRGWRPQRYDFDGHAPSDDDYVPIFEQKGVDMRIGLDIASYSERRLVERILLMTTDSDMVAAMKYARRAGMEVGIIQLPEPYRELPGQLLQHSDFVRDVAWKGAN
jgi:uncharacterized LabA/DUF88 family protein